MCETTTACVSLKFSSILCKILIAKVAVLPVPDCACAIISLPSRNGLIALGIVNLIVIILFKLYLQGTGLLS